MSPRGESLAGWRTEVVVFIGVDYLDLVLFRLVMMTSCCCIRESIPTVTGARGSIAELKSGFGLVYSVYKQGQSKSTFSTSL